MTCCRCLPKRFRPANRAPRTPHATFRRTPFASVSTVKRRAGAATRQRGCRFLGHGRFWSKWLSVTGALPGPTALDSLRGKIGRKSQRAGDPGGLAIHAAMAGWQFPAFADRAAQNEPHCAGQSAWHLALVQGSHSSSPRRDAWPPNREPVPEPRQAAEPVCPAASRTLRVALEQPVVVRHLTRLLRHLPGVTGARLGDGTGHRSALSAVLGASQAVEGGRRH